jgi:hypothetical protein
MATARDSEEEGEQDGDHYHCISQHPNAAVSNCLQGGWDEDKKDEDEGDGREDDTMTEEEDEERTMTKDDEGPTMKGRGRMREMTAQETSLTFLGP